MVFKYNAIINIAKLEIANQICEFAKLSQIFT
jgi:hypothetical protein